MISIRISRQTGYMLPWNKIFSGRACFSFNLCRLINWFCCCCIVVLRPLLTSKVMSGRSVNLTTLFLGRLRPPKRLTSTSCTYFRQELTTALLEKSGRRNESMLPDRVSDPGPLTYESGALPIALRGPAVG